MSAYKVFLGDNEFVQIEDSLALNMYHKSNLISWLHDIIAPFYQFNKISFYSKVQSSDIALGRGCVKMESGVQMKGIGSVNIKSSSNITITENGISEFEFHNEKINIKATCIKY